MNDRKIEKERKPNQKPVIGITMGDFNGIGTEVILKALSSNRILKMCTPVIYGSMRVISKYRKMMKLNDWFINQVQSVQQVSSKKTNLVTTWHNRSVEIQPGRITEEAGKFAIASIKAATEDLKKGLLDAVVTAPINKNNVQNDEFNFPGHTEYFAESFSSKNYLMLMVAEELRVGLVTGHIPLEKVAENISQELIIRKLQILMSSLQKDFGIVKPKVALLGLNPHAGEEGVLGTQEQKLIRPAIIDLKKKGNLVFGPYSPDGFFGRHEYRKFDGVLAMYHDQGLIPFKTLAFDRGVNFTAGLPIVRTSPDHGTAYDIAGKGIADETSMLCSIFQAVDIVKTRKGEKIAENAVQMFQ